MQKINTKEIELFISYGSAASEAMFDYPCYFFRIPNKIGVIAYRIEFNCAVIFGDPLCPPHELIELTQAFHKYCHDSHLNVIYITVSPKFAGLAQKYCPISIEVCEELIFDPQINLLLKSHRLQHRVDKAIKQGLTFHEYTPFDKEIEKSLLEIGIQWQKEKKGPNFYLGHLNFFENPKGKRWFYVKDGEQIISMAMLSQLDAQAGWLLKFLFTLPNAFLEASEFLMIYLLATLKKENCHFLTKGMVPIDSIEEVRGFRYCSILMKYIYKMISFIFKFKTHKQYWERYYPKKVPSYLLFSNSKIGFNEIRALLKVLKMNY
jgi:lysylphosphatidylglycerol synthetase-like protein (DUF2156 family)